MGLLKWFALLPVRLLCGLWWLVTALLRPLVGEVSWRAPGWVRLVGSALRKRPRWSAGILVVLTVLALAGWYGWQWYQNLPEPERMAFRVSAPAVTNYNPEHGDEPIVHPLVVTFSGSAAPIEKVDKKISHGIAISPDVDGIWKWVNDHTLRFTPASDWPVGQDYRVHFTPEKLFAPQVDIARDHFEFGIKNFRGKLARGEFHQDPKNPKIKQVIQKITFNYPVDPVTLEKRVHLTIAGREGKPDKSVEFSLQYDEHKLTAWIRSESLKLPRDPGKLLINVDAGVASSRGGDGATGKMQNRVGIPGLYSLRVRALSPKVANNDDDEPQQVLIAHFNAAVRAGDVAEHIQAWVLPKHKSGDEADHGQKPYRWSLSEISETVLHKATRLNLSVSPTERNWQKMQSFKFKAKPGRRVFVHVGKPLESFGGYRLAKPVGQVFTVPNYPQMLSLVGDGSLLSLSGSERISIASRNLPGFRLVIGRVKSDQLQHLASLNRGDFSHPRLPGGFSEDQIVDRFEVTRALPGNDPGKVDYSGVGLKDYLGDGKRGVFWVHLSGYDPDAAADKARQRQRNCEKTKQKLARPTSPDGIAACQPSGGQAGQIRNAPTDNRLIVVTNLGMLVKKTRDGHRDVFVQSIHDGRPVANAQVRVMAVNGETLLSQTTGGDGMVTFPDLANYQHDEKPAMYLVTKGDDMSFLPVASRHRRLGYSRFDVGGASNEINPGQLSGYLFSDRGLYRPGEDLHLGAIVRAADWSRNVAGIPLQAKVKNPRNKTVKTIPLVLDKTGFGELNYTLADTAATGEWKVDLYITQDGKADTRIASRTVAVKQFTPDRMKVHASLSRQLANGWVKPDELKGEVEATNLFGTPAADRRVSASITLQPVHPGFKGWSGWHFHDTRHAEQSYEHDLSDQHTDSKGQATFPLDLSRYNDATYELTFLARVFEAGSGHKVADMARTMVSSNDWLIGYKSDDDLDYIKRGATRKVHLIAIDHHAEATDVSGLTARLLERKHVSVLTKQPSGAYKYESHLKKEQIESHSLDLDKDGKTLTLNTDKPGEYELVIRRDSDGKQVNRIRYSVAGSANVSRSLERNAELQLKLDKDEYEPGDTIDVAIRAPYTGNGLITIERDKVYAHTWFHTDTTSSVQHIRIPEDFKGNGYINVQFVRDPSSDAIFMSPLSYGVVPFKLSHDQHRTTLDVNVPDLIKPGHKATFHLHSAKPAKVVLFAVNEGILQVARYHLKDPLDYFFRKRRLDVSTAQILDLILPEFEQLMNAASTPGGDRNAAVSRRLNPFHRKKKEPVAYWSGIVDVDGNKDFTYDVPDDFNGKLRVMAVAVTPDRIGTWQGETTVRDDFVLTPNTPKMLAPGDEARISVGVANNLDDIGDKAIPVRVSLNAGQGLKVIGDAQQSIDLASMAEGKVTFRVKATSHLGASDLDFSARHGGHETALSTDISVRPKSAYRVSIDTARVAAGSNTAVDDLRQLYAPYSQDNAVMSSSPIVLARGLTSYLINYPNKCTEQLVSKAIPRLIVPDWPASQAFIPALQPAFGKHAIGNHKALNKLLAALQSRQNSAGGFGIWSATPASSPFVSAYAVNFLLEAREHGIPVPQDTLHDANGYLRELARNRRLRTLYGLRQRAYAIYLLTREGHVTTSLIASVQKRLDALYPGQWHKDIAAAWLAASYQLLKKDNEANELIAGPQQVLERHQAKKGRFSFAHYYGPAVRDATVLYLLARHFPDRAANLPADAIENIAWPLRHDHYNTLSSAMTLLALDAYAGINAQGLDKMAIKAVSGSGDHAATTSIGQATGNLLQADGWDANVRALHFHNGSDQPAWSVVTQSGYDRQPPEKAIKNGLEIIRDYTDDNGNPLETVVLGQEIRVHVKIRATGDTPVNHVIIADLLPGGFERVLRNNPAADKDKAHWSSPIGLSSSSWHPDHADIRADRVLIYGTATPNIREFTYKIRATNAGKFQVPPVFASTMYQPDVQAQEPGGETITVVPAD